MPRARDPMPGATRQPAIWPWVAVLMVALALTAWIGWQVWPRSVEPASLSARPLPSQPSFRPSAGERRGVRLFFPRVPGGMFKEVEREILRRITLAEEIRAVLRELAAGSAPDGQPPIPPETELRQVFLDPFGILYLDFSKAFLGVISTLGVQPHLAVSAIVMTLTLSFSEIKRVQFLVDGQEINFVSGALDLRRPVGLRFPGEEVQPTISQPPE